MISHMNQRLDTIYRLIGRGRGVIDVGTDHGYIPVRLASENYPGRIYASDIRESPLSVAKENAVEAAVDDRISFLLSDGLDACAPDSVDCVVIAGMGGDTICGILDRAEWTMDPAFRLILQPMSKAEVLRYWLSSNGYRITDERIAAEGDNLYQIIVASFCEENEAYNDAELLIGKPGRADPALYRQLALRHAESLRRRIEGLASAGEREKTRLIPWLREMLIQLEGLRRE